MHVLHLHGLQRHHRLAGCDALALFDQNRNDTAVHRRADLAVAAGCRRRGRRGQRQIADDKRDAPMQHMEPVAVLEKSCRFHQAVGLKTDRIAAKLTDLEPVLAAIQLYGVTTIALARDFQILNATIKLKTSSYRKGCRERPS